MYQTLTQRVVQKIAPYQSFVQNEIGVKYKTMQNGPPSKISLFLAITPISAYYYNNKLYT